MYLELLNPYFDSFAITFLTLIGPISLLGFVIEKEECCLDTSPMGSPFRGYQEHKENVYICG